MVILTYKIEALENVVAPSKLAYDIGYAVGKAIRNIIFG